MRKTKAYEAIRFHPRVYRRVVEACRRFAKNPDPRIQDCSTGTDSEKWGFDNLEEFFSSLASADVTSGTLHLFWDGATASLYVAILNGGTHVNVESPQRHVIEAVFSILEEAGPDDRLPLVEKHGQEEDIRVFIGHGRNPQWEKLKAHLQDKHGLDVIC